MKLSLALLPILCSLTSAQLLYPFKEGPPPGEINMPTPDSDQKPLQQHTPSDAVQSNDKPTGAPLLSDLLAQDKTINIFSDLTRKIESISTRVSDAEVNTTVLAPSNVAITRLPRKPWEDPNDEGAGGNIFSDIYKGLVGEDRATRNFRTFVEAHCIDVSPWPKGEKTKTLQGKEIWWDEDDSGAKTIYPDNIAVVEGHPTKGAPNGELWVLNGVINY